MVEEPITFAVDEILCLPGTGPVLADPYIPILHQLAKEKKPELFLFGPGILSKDLCAALAGFFKGSCAVGITGIEQNSEGMRISRRVFGLQLEAVFQYSQSPYLFSIAKDCFEPVTDMGHPKLSTPTLSLAEPDWYAGYTEFTEETQEGIESCDLIFAGGRGLGSKEAMMDMAELGRRMGAAIGGTRPAALNAWLPLSQMIGLSGLVVKPKLCLAFGISGCAPFVKGVEKSECIIAINQDPDAAIFRHSDVGLIADCNAVIQALLERTGGSMPGRTGDG
jgi:electron transfer flavoprotein alpha subunit